MISVIIPTYNESDNIKVMVLRIYDILTDSGLDGEIIIVDDNSSDGTVGIAAGLA